MKYIVDTEEYTIIFEDSEMSHVDMIEFFTNNPNYEHYIIKIKPEIIWKSNPAEIPNINDLLGMSTKDIDPNTGKYRSGKIIEYGDTDTDHTQENIEEIFKNPQQNLK